MNVRKLKVCPHCRDLVNVLRGCGNMAGADAQHYLMASAIGALNEGHTLEDTIEVLRLIWRAEESERESGGYVGVDLGAQDVSVVAVVPVNAIDAFVASLGERPA